MSLINNIKTIILDLITIRSKRVFAQPRSFYFRVFKKEYPTYKFWIEPRCPSNLPLDVIIPAIEKDAATLPHAINGIKKHIKHPIGNVYIVAPPSMLIKQIAGETGCKFVNEQDVCSISKHEIGFIFNGHNRSGWIYQQLLKFNFDKVGTARHHLVVDADTIFVKDICFESKGALYFDFSEEYHTPYHKAYELLTGLKHTMPVSFVAHYMLFDKHRLLELKSHIEKHTKKTAEHAIIDLKHTIVDQSNFSEYETYANYCIAMAPQRHRIRYWFNKGLNNETVNMETINANKGFKSVSFHNYNT